MGVLQPKKEAVLTSPLLLSVTVKILNLHLNSFYYTVCKLTKKVAIFQQNNTSIHITKITKNWLKKNKIVIIDWLANFLDLNPIKNIWK